jgi:negative regulator of sigma E activity
MTVDDTATEWDMAVTNGNRLREYHFRNLGHESLAQGAAAIDTLHLQGSRAGEGTLDVWLAPSRHWLPLRIRTLDQKGKVLVLSLEEDS